jgi:topoisomerase IA-like protein
MDSNVQAVSVAFINGQLVNAEELTANYDGKHLAIDMNKNGHHFSKILNNKDIQQILTQPAHKLALEDRLQRDFLGMKAKTKKAKTKKAKTKKATKAKTKKT